MIVLGVDPGAISAAWAAIPPEFDGGVRKAMADFAPVVNKMVDPGAFKSIIRHVRPTVAVVEKVNAMPKQGVSSSFRFGMGYGMLLAVLACEAIPVVDVAPGVWKKHFRLDADKEKARALAIKRFPNADLKRKIDAGKAEALLMALWWRETSESYESYDNNRPNREHEPLADKRPG